MSNRIKRKKTFQQKSVAKSTLNLEQLFDSALNFLRYKEFKKAEQHFKHILKVNPKHPDTLGCLGIIAAQEEDFAKAEKYYRASIKGSKQNPSVFNNLAIALKNQGKYEEAVKAIAQAIALEPHYFEAYANMGNVLGKMGKDHLLECIEAYKQALGLKPNTTDIMLKVGKVLDDNDEFEKALSQFDRVIELEAGNYTAFLKKAQILEHASRFAEALENIEQAIALQKDIPGSLLCKAKILFRQKSFSEALAQLNHIPIQLEKENDDEDGVNQAVCRLQADIYNQSADYDKAFELYTQANNKLIAAHKNRIKQLRKKNLYYGADPLPLKSWFTPKKIAASTPYVPNANSSPCPVFMVGFSRSGTTLLDNILDSHQLISTLEEKPTLNSIHEVYSVPEGQKRLEKLSTKSIDKYRSKYWQEVEKHLKHPLAAGNLLVDSHPFGAPYLGHIDRFFPDSKILVAIRDPRDVVLSSFMQGFQCNIATQNLYDLKEAAQYYATNMDMMLYFRENLTLPFHFVYYENLVQDLESEAKKVISFLELEWDDNLLNFHKTAQKKKVRTASYHQVTQPIYKTALQRWKKYEKHLEHILPILQPYVDLFEKERGFG